MMNMLSSPQLANRFPMGREADGIARSRQRRVAERAKALASGLAQHEPGPSIPRALIEPNYLCEESHNAARPLLERLRILGLMATSLDQFCVDQGVDRNRESEDADSEQPVLFSDEFCTVVTDLLARSSRLLRVDLLPGLARERGVLLRQPATLSREQRMWLRSFFHAQIFPLLTPLAIDPGHPFPFISSYSLNFLVQLRGLKPGTVKPGGVSATNSYARVKVPRMLSRFVEVPRLDREDALEDAQENIAVERSFMWSEEIVRFFLPELFPGLSVENACLFRVMRPLPTRSSGDADFDPQSMLRRRHLHASVVRLDVEADMPEAMLAWLSKRLAVPTNGIYRIDGNMALFQLTDMINLVEGDETVRALI